MALAVFQDCSLKEYNTFHIDVKAKYLIKAYSTKDIHTFLKEDLFASFPLLILGGGSNLLFTKSVDGVVLKIESKGIQLVREEDDDVWLRVEAGEVWQDFVTYCVEKGYGGLENLALIPGTVGAAPIQNIGAYGVEVKEVIEQVETIEIDTLHERVFDNATCAFDYRTSIFKTTHKGKYIVTAVVFRLHKNKPVNVTYGDIKKQLGENNHPTYKEMADAISAIRLAKLPDPDKLGNAGSFFKNPYVSKIKLDTLKNDFPDIVSYPITEDIYKLAAGWLIEKAGWKGKSIGVAGVHDKQALVLVNYGQAAGLTILLLAKQVQDAVQEMFGVTLDSEVNII